MDIFGYKNYLSFLKDQMSVSNDKGWGSITRLAEATGCQRSHISRVLNGQNELSLEQAYEVAKFFELNAEESDYFILLVQMSRAGNKEYQAHLQKKIELIQKEKSELSKRLKRDDKINHELAAFYYSAWHWSAIHIVTSVGQGLTAEQIAARLEIPKELVLSCLKKLAEFGLVQKQDQRWKYETGTTHLGKNSPYLPIHHQNWRLRAVVDAQDSQSDGIHYTVVHTMSKSSFQKLKNLLLKTIDDYDAVATPSEPEELVSFNLDLTPFK